MGQNRLDENDHRGHAVLKQDLRSYGKSRVIDKYPDGSVEEAGRMKINSSLKVFEKRAREIFHYICPYRMRGIVDPFTQKVILQSKMRLGHADFATAQTLIINELKFITARERDIQVQLKVARGRRDKSIAMSLEQEARKEKFKGSVIRKLADSIAWQLLNGRNDFIQQLYRIDNPPSIDESNLDSVLEVVDEMNQEDPLSFALISDLTSFVQVGDILRKDTSGIIKLIEVKEGRANKEAVAIVKNELLVERDNLDIEKLKVAYGPHLAKQIRRTHNQLRKSLQVESILNTGEGQDPTTGSQVIIREPSHSPQYYTHKLAEMLLELKHKPWAYTIIDNCLMIGCYKGAMKEVGKPLLELLANRSLKRNTITISFSQGLNVPTCEPVFLKPFREDDIFDIVFDRIRLIMVLRLDWVMYAFRQKGFDVSWLSAKETTKLLQQNRYDRPFVLDGRSLAIENDKWSLYLTGGALRRMLFDNVLPSWVISTLSDSLGSKDSRHQPDNGISVP
jgi:hypothetical protein